VCLCSNLRIQHSQLNKRSLEATFGTPPAALAPHVGEIAMLVTAAASVWKPRSDFDVTLAPEASPSGPLVGVLRQIVLVAFTVF
jgi:hypothetical protein